MYWLSVMKEKFYNYMARWFIKHCGELYCDTIYTLLYKLDTKKIQRFAESMIKWKEEKGEKNENFIS